VPVATSTVDLLPSDDPEPFALVGGSLEIESGEFARLQKLFASFNRRYDFPLALESPEGFQDGSLFTCARELAGTPGEAARGGFYFSRFGRLFTGGLESPASSIPLETWTKIKEALSSDHQYLYVPAALLKSPYDGEHRCYSRMTWNERLFSPFYSKLMGSGRARSNTSLERTREG
jgi:hypothetical protein